MPLTPIKSGASSRVEPCSAPRQDPGVALMHSSVSPEDSSLASRQEPWTASPPDSFATPRLSLAVIGVIGIATWALSHSYRGLFHDAGLYTLQALARLHPDSLREDVFLKFGSQDGLTIFSPIYAAASRLLGVEPAAATLTLLLQWAL